MVTTIESVEINPLVLQIKPAINMTEEQFFNFCQLNSNYAIERNSQGDLIIMSPNGTETGHRNAKLTQQLGIWADEDATGIDFDSSASFILPNSAIRSPDAAWIKLVKWQAIPPSQRNKFAPICPDFVVELRSPTDSLQTLKNKLLEYIDNGASLGWLIDCQNRQVYIYRPQQEVECLNNPDTISGEPILPKFSLKMSKIW